MLEDVHRSADDKRKRVSMAELDKSLLLTRIKMLEDANTTLQ